MILKTAVTLQVKKTSSSDIIYNNGNFIKYQLLIKPINKTQLIDYSKQYFEVSGLKPGRNYTFQCKAATKGGFGPYGELLMVTMENDIPSPPFSIISIGNSHNLLIQWKKPVESHGTITKYEIRVTLNNRNIQHFYHTKTELIYPFKFPASSVEQVSIRAYTTAGHSIWSDPFIVSVMPGNQLKKQSALIIGFSVAFGVFAAFVVMCFIYFRR